MKRILFFINTLNTGGAERVLIDLVRKLPKDRFRITVQCLAGGRFESELPEDIELRQILRSKNPFLMKVFSKLPWLTGRLFVKNNYDIEVAYLEGFPTKVIASRTKSRAKKIAVIHTNTAQTDMIRILYPNEAACLQQYGLFDRTVFVSGDAMEGFFRMFGALDRAQVVHNVIDFTRVRKQAQLPCPEHYTTKGLRLVAVGRLIKLKGFDRLIRICAELEKEFDFELLLLGGGEEQSALEAVIAETGARSVRLMGMQSNPYTYMQKADLLVCSSFAEGYSTTMMEALALGLPVLTAACAGMDEILEGGKWGKIVGLSDDELREGLRQVLSDRTLYDDLKQRAMARKEQLTDKTSVTEYLQLFDEVMKE